MVWVIGGGFIGVVVAAVMYGLGGREGGPGKGIRRFGASFVLALTVNLLAIAVSNWNWWLLCLYPLLIGQFVLGYGGNSGIPKMVQRAMISVIAIGTGAFCCWIFGGNYWLLIIHACMSLPTIMFSFKNPIAAAAEEPLVCVLNNLMLSIYPFIIKG